MLLAPACGDSGPRRIGPHCHADAAVDDAAGCDEEEEGTDGPGDEACPGPFNPSGEFANTLIRGTPPDGAFPGDSWEALVHADALGYRYVEVDVRETADGRLVPARHDDLAQFSDCDGSLAASTVEDLAACHYQGSETTLAPIEDGLAGSGFRGVYLDLKSTATAPFSTPDSMTAALLSLLGRTRMSETVVAMSYDSEVAIALVEAEVRTALKGYPDDVPGSLDLVEDAADIRAEMVCVQVTALDAGAYERASAAGVWLLPWAHAAEVDSASMELLLSSRAGGIISSIPDEVSALVAAYCPP